MLPLRSLTLDRLAWRLFMAAIFTLFLFSPHLLIRLGYPYEAPLQGALPFKIHPGTYLVTLSLLCALAGRGHPLRAAFHLAGREPLIAIHLAVMVTCLAWVLYRHGSSGAAFIVDSHWLPALAALALMHFDDRRLAFLFRALAALMLTNALLALLEVATQARLTPLYLQVQGEGLAQEDHFRASALFGHPLSNAKMAASLLPMALLLPMHGALRWAHVVLVGLSMLAFGGRAALFVAALVYGGWGVARLCGDLVRGRFSYLQLSGGSVFLLLAGVAMVALVITTGLGERIFANLYLDNSAGVRLRVWQAFDHLSAEQLWLGISARDIDLVALRLGLDPKYEAIENGWIYLSLQFGLVVFALWVIGFVCLITWTLRHAAPLAGAGVVAYVLVASTSNAFASKSVGSALLVTYAVASAAQLRRNRLMHALRAQASALSSRRAGMTPPAWGAAAPIHVEASGGAGRAVPRDPFTRAT
jgi:hypothetical protein